MLLREPLVHVHSVGHHDIHFIRIPDDHPSYWEWEYYDLFHFFVFLPNKTFNSTTIRGSAPPGRTPIYRIYHNTTLRSLTHEANGDAYLSVDNIMDRESKFTLSIGGKGTVHANLNVADLVLSLSGQARCRLTGTAQNVMIFETNNSSAFVDAFNLDIDRLILSASNRTRLILGNVNKFINSADHKSTSFTQLNPKDPKAILLFDADNNYQILH